MQGRIEPWMSTYFHNKGAQLGIPVSGTFELTRRCNFNCKMCYVHDGGVTDNGELSKEKWLELAEEAKKSGMLFLLLTGGEPLLRSDFCDIYEALAKMGFLISINTNGSLVNEKILELLKKYPPLRVNISLYGASEETYNSLCGVRSFEKTVDSIKKINSLNIPVRITLAVSSYNKDDVEKIYGISNELGIPIRSTSYIYPSVRVDGKDYCDVRLTPEDAGKMCFKMKQLDYTWEQLHKKAESLAVSADIDCDYSGHMRCRAGKSSVWLTYDGKIIPCGMLATPEYDVLKDGFNECWNKVRNGTSEIEMPAECGQCPDRKDCNVCAAMCYSETGHFNKRPEYICKMLRETKKQFMSVLNDK